MISNNDYEKFVQSRTKPGVCIDTSPRKSHIQHMLMGLMGELGELTDAFKKWIVYDQDLDLDNVQEELGDLEFYMAGLRNELFAMGGMTRQDILVCNKEKLSVRYPSGYTNEHAEERIDKKG